MSPESQEPTNKAPESPGIPSTGVTVTSRARALLRVRAYNRAWRAHAVGALGDRLALLTLLALTVVAVVGAQALGGGYTGVMFAVAAVFGARIVATLLFGAVLLAPLAQLTQRLDRRWLLVVAEALRGVLLACSVFWVLWTGSKAWVWLLVTVFVTAALERLIVVTRESFVEQLLPAPTPGHPPVDQRPVLLHIELWTGYATVPLASVLLIVLTLVNQGLGQAVDWLGTHGLALGAFGAAALFLTAGTLQYLQELPEAATGRRRFEPHSPLTNLRAPADVTPGLVARGRTGSSLVFSLAATSTAAAVAAAASTAVQHAVDLQAGTIGYALLVLALTAGLLLGLRVSRGVLPTLSRRRLLPLAMGTTGLALLLGGLVRDYVLALVLFTLAGVASGVAFRTARVLLALETEDARRPRVDEHLHAMLRVAVALGLVVTPLLGAVYGPEQFGGTTLTFDHGGAGLATATAGLLLLLLAVVVLLRADDRKGVAPLPRDIWDALRGGVEPPAHRAGTGFFIALEGGDGAGKSTQAQALAEWIRSKGHEVVLTREPGGSAVGQRLRAMLLDVANTGISHRAEALIFAADRAEHVDSVILPALERGAVVITDRYADSSIAYQGAGRDLDGADVARLNRWATGGLVPDLTVLLDVAPSAARERFTEAPDRMESEPEVFHQRVRAAFLELAAADAARYLVVDAGQPPQAVTTAIRHRLDRELPLSEKEKAALVEQERLAREAEARRLAEEARRKAEEERAERERQAQLEKLRLEAEEAEKARQAEEDRRAAEVARLAAEAARAAAAAEAARRAAEEEERRRAEEQARREAAAEAERLAELERQREAKKAEERRRVEEALLRSEASRRAAEEAAKAAEVAEAAKAAEAEQADRADRAEGGAGDEAEAESAASGHIAAGFAASQASAASDEADEERTAVLPAVAADGPADLDATAVMPAVVLADEAPASEDAPETAAEPERTSVLSRARSKARSARGKAQEEKEESKPLAKDAPSTTPAAADETMVLPAFPAGAPTVGMPSKDGSDTKSTTNATKATGSGSKAPKNPKGSKAAEGSAATSAADETTVIPVVEAAPTVQTPLPRAWREATPRSSESVQDKVPDWLFRPEPGEAGPEDATREIPALSTPSAARPKGDTASEDGEATTGSGRYDWAEETPLDDLPSLTDQLLGTREEWAQWHDEHPGDEQGPGNGRRH
ncbi:dTMP kinase [Streptacidiphilus fuscans]|uniref:Thymidylate kinase n=1 Tax=Streptacidiphilus fuscans TaxID=2789292 RepID=A0A931FG78_9ACTN|nr:dTMP kinase [Streptacidiphilus fuscans]MBF9070611.1 dTMP kinase [Streptacidiphilus fuscans]